MQVLPELCSAPSNLWPGRKGNCWQGSVILFANAAGQLGAPPCSRQDAPPLLCWHIWKMGLHSFPPPRLHHPRSCLMQVSCVCQALLCACTASLGNCFCLFFALQWEGKRKEKAEEGGIKLLVLWDAVCVLSMTLSSSPPSCRPAHFSQTCKLTLEAPWLSQPSALRAG